MVIKLEERGKKKIMVSFRLDINKQSKVKEIAEKKGMKIREVYEAMVDALIKQEGV